MKLDIPALVLFLYNPSSPGSWTLVPISDGMGIRGESFSGDADSSPDESGESSVYGKANADQPAEMNAQEAPPVKKEPIKPFKTLKFWEKYNVSVAIKNDTLIFQSNYPEKTLLIQSHIGKEYLRKQFDEDSVYIALEQVLDKYDLPDNTQLTVKLLAKGFTVYEGYLLREE